MKKASRTYVVEFDRSIFVTKTSRLLTHAVLGHADYRSALSQAAREAHDIVRLDRPRMLREANPATRTRSFCDETLEEWTLVSRLTPEQHLRYELEKARAERFGRHLAGFYTGYHVISWHTNEKRAQAVARDSMRSDGPYVGGHVTVVSVKASD